MLHQKDRPSLFSGLDRQRRPLAVQRAIAELRAARPVLVTQEGQGVLVMAAELATAETLADLAAHAGPLGLVLTPQRLERLGVRSEVPMRLAVPAEIAAVEALIADAAPQAPVLAQQAGTLEAGALDLARLSLLLPALIVSAPVSGHPGWAMDVLAVSLSALQDYRPDSARELSVVSRAKVPLVEAAQAEFVVFRGGDALRDQVAIVIGQPDPAQPVDVRLHSACLTGDLFGSLRCDCGDQLRKAVAELTGRGGVLLYLDQEGRGTGIASKMRAYALQDTGLDTVEADALLGYGADERRYETAARMLTLLGFRRVALLTNNPDKIAALAAGGLEVAGRTALYGAVTAQNQRYLSAKAAKAGHMLEGIAPELAAGR